MAASLFPIVFALPALSILAIPAAASSINHFDPAVQGNLIGPIILTIAFIIHRIHAHRVGISTWWRNHNPSLVALPRPPIGPYRPIELAVIQPHHLQHSDRMARDINDSRLSVHGFLNGDGGAGSGLVGVGSSGNNATVGVPGGPVSLGVGFDEEWRDAEMRHFGPAAATGNRRRGCSIQIPERETADGQPAAHRRAPSGL